MIAHPLPPPPPSRHNNLRDVSLITTTRYDVLWTPDNVTSMIEQVTKLRTHPSILSWYQSDEADGKSNPLNSTGMAYNTIKELDPYHPISLALNCYDFYYADYAAGADIVAPGTKPYPLELVAYLHTRREGC